MSQIGAFGRYNEDMKMNIEKIRESSIFYDGKFYDTGMDLDVPFSEAFRLTRVAKVDAEWLDVPYDPATFHQKHFFNFMGDVDMTSGFGGVSYSLIKESLKKYEIALAGRFLDVKDHQLFAARNRALEQSAAMVWHDQPRDSWGYSPFRKNVAIVPFETTIIPSSWIPKINAFDALLVPCKQNIEAFANSGVKVPIELIHWGVDPLRFAPVERPERDIFTFGTMGYLTIRKGTDVLIEAFREAFPREQDVRLICKTSFLHYPFGVNDKRIVVQQGAVSPKEMEDEFTKQIDCFVFPTRGEGFGLTPLEMMATGVPAIVTGWSGPMEYMNPEVGWLLDYKLAPAEAFTKLTYHEECGDWAEPSKDHLVQLLRHAYEHRDEVKQKGFAAQKYVQENWLWKDKIGMYHNALEKFL